MTETPASPPPAPNVLTAEVDPRLLEVQSAR